MTALTATDGNKSTAFDVNCRQVTTKSFPMYELKFKQYIFFSKPIIKIKFSLEYNSKIRRNRVLYR